MPNKTIKPTSVGNLAQPKQLFRQLLRGKKPIRFACKNMFKDSVGQNIAKHNMVKLSVQPPPKLFTNKQKYYLFTLDQADLPSPNLPPYGLVALVLQSYIRSKEYQKPLLLQLNLAINPVKHERTMGKEINLVKKQIKNFIKVGGLNFRLSVTIKNPKQDKIIYQNIARFLHYLSSRGEKKPGIWQYVDRVKNKDWLYLDHS